MFEGEISTRFLVIFSTSLYLFLSLMLHSLNVCHLFAISIGLRMQPACRLWLNVLNDGLDDF